MDETTLLLRRIGRGDKGAEEQLYRRLQDELRAGAGALMARQRPGHSLQPTALVNEAWLKLANLEEASFQDRTHFLRTAVRAMRSVLVDHARARLAEKRGGGGERVELAEAEEPPDSRPAFELLMLHEALERLEALEPAAARVAQQRLFGGLSHAEIAEIEGVSERTVERSWRAARAFLEREMG